MKTYMRKESENTFPVFILLLVIFTTYNSQTWVLFINISVAIAAFGRNMVLLLPLHFKKKDKKWGDALG